MNKIAKGLRADRRATATASGGYFGAMQLLPEVEARFRVPPGGGRPTDPRWTERRSVPLAPRTLKRLEEIAAKLHERSGANLEPMRLAALLLAHLLKLCHQPDRRRLSEHSWRATIEHARDSVAELVEENPSLEPPERTSSSSVP